MGAVRTCMSASLSNPFQADHDRQSPHKLRDEAVLQQVVRIDVLEYVASLRIA